MRGQNDIALRSNKKPGGNPDDANDALEPPVPVYLLSAHATKFSVRIGLAFVHAYLSLADKYHREERDTS